MNAKILFVFLLTGMLMGCNSSSQSIEFLHMEEGYIAFQKEGRVLITEKANQTSPSLPEAAWYQVNEHTQIINDKGEKLSFSELMVGKKVRTWNDGHALESYPSQSKATKILVFTESKWKPSSNLSESEAVRIAFQQYDDKKLWFINHITFDENKGRWMIDMNDYDGEGSNLSIQVDDQTGKMIVP